jgi:hypothetical protein
MASESSKFGDLISHFEKQFYYPGEKVKGSVYVNIIDNFPALGLELNLQIIESVKFRENDLNYFDSFSEAKVKGRTSYKRSKIFVEEKLGTIDLYSNSYPIAKFNNNVIVTGQYVYPLIFTLPKHLPGSFEYYDEESSAYIKYILTTRLISANENEEDIIYTDLIIVRQHPNDFQYENNATDEKNVYTCYCIDQGFARLNVSFPRKFYILDEGTIKVICELDNGLCKLSAKCITLQFFQRITLKDDQNNYKFNYRKISDHRYIGKYRKRQNNIRALEINLNMFDNTNPSLKNAKMCEHLNLFKNKEILGKLQATVTSELIQCKYYLKVKTEYKGGFFSFVSNTPFIELPIILYSPEDYKAEIKSKPLDWDPVIMPLSILDIPTAEQLGIECGKKSSSLNVNLINLRA